MLVAKVEGTTARIVSTLQGVWALEELLPLVNVRVGPPSSHSTELQCHRRHLRPLKGVTVNKRTFDAAKVWLKHPVSVVMFMPAKPFGRYGTPGILYVAPTDPWQLLCGLPGDCSYQGTPINVEHRNVLPTWTLAHLGAVCVWCGADLTDDPERRTWVEPECPWTRAECNWGKREGSGESLLRLVQQ